MPRQQPSPSDTTRTEEAGRQATAFGSVQESAQQIWLAGLGAFAKAQAEGGKVFEGLVKDGLSLQRQTQVAAEAKLAEAAGQLASLTQATTGMVTSVAAGLRPAASHSPAQPWEKLEGIFETRVARALANMGLALPASHAEGNELEDLKAQVQALRERLDLLEGGLPKPPAKTAKTRP